MSRIQAWWRGLTPPCYVVATSRGHHRPHRPSYPLLELPQTLCTGHRRPSLLSGVHRRRCAAADARRPCTGGQARQGRWRGSVAERGPITVSGRASNVALRASPPRHLPRRAPAHSPSAGVSPVTYYYNVTSLEPHVATVKQGGRPAAKLSGCTPASRALARPQETSNVVVLYRYAQTRNATGQKWPHLTPIGSYATSVAK